ncbi:kelch-like protein 12 [Arctopsyche grandis]|uniref:kelch-like protein 12 n=1 Tax=Arctopsyche grandis TaxID=121162 RepID=UPI00406D6C19
MDNQISETFINPEYGDSELSIMYEFYKHGTLCDMTILAEEERFYTHKLVLAICCRYFRNQIIENPDLNEFDISIDDETFEKILKFFYKGSVQLDMDSVQRLILAAKLLQLNVLFDICCKFLANHLSADNIFDIKTFAETNSLYDLVDKVNKYNEDELPQELFKEENSLSIQEEENENISQTSKDNISDSLEEVVSPPKTNKIMVVGGENEPIASYVDFYDPDTKSWLETKYMNLKRTDFGVIKLQNYVIVIGGKRARKALNEVVGVHLDTMEASALLPMETNRKHLCVSSILDQDRNIILYAIGGHDDTHFVNSVEKCHPVTRTWSNVSPMTANRGCFAVAVIDKKIFAIGGKNDGEILNSVEVYSVKDDTWTVCSPMNQARCYAGVAVIGNNIYVIGGSDDEGPVLSVERYDVKNDLWMMLDSSNFPEDLKYASAGNFGENIIVVGGRLAFSYDPQNNTWDELASLRSSRQRPLIINVSMAGKKVVKNLSGIVFPDED